MKITYKLKAVDFLEYQLYTNSKSELNNKKRRNSKIRIPILYLFLGLFFIYNNSDLTGYIFIFFGLLWYGFYPKYASNRVKKYLINYIKENFTEKINIENELNFQDEYIYVKNENEESKILTNKLKKIVELNDYYFIFLSKIESFIIPKSIIQDETEFKEQMNKYNIEYVDERKWKWD